MKLRNWKSVECHNLSVVIGIENTKKVLIRGFHEFHTVCRWCATNKTPKTQRRKNNTEIITKEERHWKNIQSKVNELLANRWRLIDVGRFVLCLMKVVKCDQYRYTLVQRGKRTSRCVNKKSYVKSTSMGLLCASFSVFFFFRLLFAWMRECQVCKQLFFWL